jgi:hypothetical protein
MYTNKEIDEILQKGFERDRSDGSILGKVKSAIYHKTNVVAGERLKSFIKNCNYSFFKNFEVSSTTTYFSIFKKSEKIVYSENFETSSWKLGLFNFERTS